MLTEKICTKCLISKSMEQFYKDKTGLSSQCKECISKRSSARYRANHPHTIRRSGTGLLEDKRCPRCKIVKSIIEFQKNASRSGGITSHCKSCIRERNTLDSIKVQNRAYVRKSRKNKFEKDPIKLKLNSMLYDAKSRAKKKSLLFNLDYDYLKFILSEKCPVLNIPFNFTNPNLSCDESPSIDRFYPKLGYVKGNISIISHLANVLKNKGTVEQHIKLTNWLVLTEKKILANKEILYCIL